MQFWPLISLFTNFFIFHGGILAIRKPFSRTFLFSRWNSGYQEAFLTNFFLFFTMEVWLSRSLSHKLFFFTMEFWLSRSLSHELFFFTMEFWLPGSLSHELFFFTMEFWLSRSLSHELFFFTMEFSKYAIWGEDSLYIYIYIYISQRVFTYDPPR
jgi:hypothetical protein